MAHMPISFQPLQTLDLTNLPSPSIFQGTPKGLVHCSSFPVFGTAENDRIFGGGIFDGFGWNRPGI